MLNYTLIIQAAFDFLFNLIIETATSTVSIDNKINDDPIVPKFNPPFSFVLVSKSPECCAEWPC